MGEHQPLMPVRHICLPTALYRCNCWLQGQAREGTSVVRAGWLMKRGEVIKNWRPRFFLLKQDGQFLGYKAEPGPESASNAAQPCNNFTVRACQV